MGADPFRGYDAWLTTDRMADAADAAYERLMDEWHLAVDAYDLPVDAYLDEHEAHGIYEAWLAFIVQVDERRSRLDAEAEAAVYEDSEDYTIDPDSLDDAEFERRWAP